MSWTPVAAGKKACVYAEDAAGNTHAALWATAIAAADTTAPSAPSALALQSPSSSPGMDSTPTITVTVGETGGTVTLYSDNATAPPPRARRRRSPTRPPPTRWTCAVTTAQADGTAVTYRAKHADGSPNANASTCSSASIAYTYDGTAPTVARIRWRSRLRAASGDTYGIGEKIEATVTFSEAVTVDTTSGTPQLALTVGSATKQMAYTATGSTGTAKRFAYTVLAGDADTDGVAIAVEPAGAERRHASRTRRQNDATNLNHERADRAARDTRWTAWHRPSRRTCRRRRATRRCR